MPADSLSADPADCPPPSAGPVVPADQPSPERVTVGECWQSLYQVHEALGESEGRWFRATRQATGETVWLRVSSRATAAGRNQLWATLQSLDSPHLQKPLEAHDGAERVEIWSAPPGPHLRRWRADHDTPRPDEIRTFVLQLSSALELLHAQGLGHFGLRPETVFVREDPNGPEFRLGGFDAVERFDQAELIPIAVDNLYAPPEAAGLFKHSPGPLLLTWDWWSLGRLVQDFILGRHVLTLAPDELLANPPRSRAQMAEALLFERDIGAYRAGAVEWMPALDAATELLLRGLLTSAREGRWGGEEVREWLAGETPKERYNQHRQQRFFRLDGRGHTPPEAAQLIRGPKHCAEMVAHVFGFEKPDRFAYFLHATRARHNFMEPLDQATKLPATAALKSTPAEVAHEVSAAVGLLMISGGEFLWRGQPLATAIPILLENAETIDQHCVLLRTLGQPVVLDLLKQQDSAAARQLDGLVKTATEAEALVARCGLRRLKPKPELTELWQLAWEQPQKLATQLEQLHAQYACTTNPHLEKIFSTPHPTRGMQVLLAWTGRDPQRHGYKTHPQVKAEKLAALTAQGRSLAQLLFWYRLERALAAGPLLFGSRWPLLGGSLTVVFLLAVHVPGPQGIALGLVPFTALALLRIGLNRWQGRLVQRWTQTTRPWTLRDSIPRCQREAKVLSDAHGLPVTLSGITAMLKRINHDIVELAKPDLHPPVAWPPRHWSAWLATAISWIALIGLTLGSAWRGVKHPPSWVAHTSAWEQTFHPKKPEKPIPPSEQKISWPYKLQLDSPFPPLEVRVEGVFDPTGAQYKAALVRAHQLIAPYKPETIEGLIAIHTQLEGELVGLLLYDGKKRTFMARNGVVIKFTPIAKQWLKIGDKFAIYIER